MNSRSVYFFLVLLFSLSGMTSVSQAVVMYEDGRQFIDGVALLRDKEDPKAYFYLPTAPRVAPRPDKSGPDMFFAKFIDPEGSTSGGLVHFLFTLDLPPERVKELEKKLKKKVGGASIVGPVPLRAEANEDTGTSFKIVSSTLTSKGGKDSFTHSLVSSGVAPVTPGSRAAVASRLNAQGATLLWESLTRPTSDISVSISASYEAAVPAYRGHVKADLSTVYDHLFRLLNRQKGYNKTEIRKQVDELIRNGAIEVDVTDRGGLRLDTGKLASLMNLVTEKLISMLFDTSQGLSKLPEYEKVPASVVKGRQKRGFMAKLFSGTGNQKYYTDNQFTLREKKDIRKASFSLLFTQNTTIKVPFDSTGNMRGIYEEWGDNKNIFRTINLKDTSFERREVFFEIDPGFYSAFKNQINSVSVSFVKKYPEDLNQHDSTNELRFSRTDIEAGKFSKSIRYPRLGLSDESWLEYGYRTLWSFRGGSMVGVPADRTERQTANSPSITLSPPVEVTMLEVETDIISMSDAEIKRLAVEFQYQLLGKKKVETIAFLPSGGDASKKVSILSDPGSSIRYRTRWYTRSGSGSRKWNSLKDDYLFVDPPMPKSTE